MGVSETAKVHVDVKPAPEVDPTELEEEVLEIPPFFDDDLLGNPLFNKIIDKDTGETIHDEL